MLRPDVVLMDIRMPVLDGLEATRQITANPDLAGVRIVILTTFELDEYLFEALRHGASGFLVKDTEPSDLVTAIHVVAEGDSLISPGMTRRLVAEFAARANTPSRNRAQGAHRPRKRGHGSRRRRPVQRRNRPTPLPQPSHLRTHVGRAITKLGARDRAHSSCSPTRRASSGPAGGAAPGGSGRTRGSSRRRQGGWTTSGSLDGSLLHKDRPFCSSRAMESTRTILDRLFYSLSTLD